MIHKGVGSVETKKMNTGKKVQPVVQPVKKEVK